MVDQWRAVGDIEDIASQLASRIERLEEALSHDREVCGRDEGLCWKCRALEGA